MRMSDDLMSRIQSARTTQAQAKLDYRERKKAQENQDKSQIPKRACSTEHRGLSRVRAPPHAREAMFVTNSHDWKWVKLPDPAHRGFHVCERCGMKVVGDPKRVQVGCF